MPAARCFSTPGSATVLPLGATTTPPTNAADSSAVEGRTTPASVSTNCASSSECETLAQPIGFVGGTIDVVAEVCAAVDVSVTGVPVLSAVASASAFAADPARVANGAATRAAASARSTAADFATSEAVEGADTSAAHTASVAMTDSIAQSNNSGRFIGKSPVGL